jgi:hypothetical protein
LIVAPQQRHRARVATARLSFGDASVDYATADIGIRQIAPSWALICNALAFSTNLKRWTDRVKSRVIRRM